MSVLSTKASASARSKEKDKEAVANPGAEVICHHCHRKGHKKRDFLDHGEGETQGGTARERRRTSTRSRSHCQLDPSETPARISMIDMDKRIITINADDHEMQVRSIRTSDGGQGSCGFSVSARVRA